MSALRPYIPLYRTLTRSTSKTVARGFFPPSISTSSRIILPHRTNIRWNSSASSSSAAAHQINAEAEVQRNHENGDGNRIEAPLEGAKSQKIGQIEPRLQMTFTCTANDCGHRSTHQFAKRSYEKGIVLVQCPECKSRHLIADHIGWFKESLEDGKLKTVEDLLAAKGEKIRKGRVNWDGDIEYDGE